ncbi:MAG: 2OG-Fe dioxygenase family protein, partial [Bacteroidota bacterium]
MFAEFEWDQYDVKRQQIEILQSAFPKDADLDNALKAYYLDQTTLTSLETWLDRLDEPARDRILQIQPWRRRAVAQFRVVRSTNHLLIKRMPILNFQQDLDQKDIRSLPRKFTECDHKYTDHEYFQDLLSGVFRLVERTRPHLHRISLTAHFMSVKARPDQAGNNSPEGAHEDGADYIISALVINRDNIVGGESQIIEQLADGSKEIICRHTLQPGEFVFQADSRDEITYGTDLWHHVTPFSLADPSRGEGWRDIIGFDINVVS